MEKPKTKKIISLAFSLLIINTLLLAGPAEGLTLTIAPERTVAYQGQQLTFNLELEINSDADIPQTITFNLVGSQSISCEFDIHGNPLSECNNVQIEIQNQNNLFGYGYGYGYAVTQGLIHYTIVLATDELTPGVYTPNLGVELSGQTTTQEAEEITIRRRSSGGGGGSSCQPQWQCSVWSQCSNGIQVRSCSRIVSSCSVQEEFPELTRSCEVPETVKLETQNTQTSQIRNLSPATITENQASINAYQFMIILLLMNCIITTLNIIIKVNEDQKKKKRKIKRKKKSTR